MLADYSNESTPSQPQSDQESTPICQTPPATEQPSDVPEGDPSLDPFGSGRSIADQVWEAMLPHEKLEAILAHWPAEEWCEEAVLNVLAVFYKNPIQWMRIKARAKQIGVNGWDLERACKAICGRLVTWELTHGSRNGQVIVEDQGLGDWLTRLMVNTRGEPAQNAYNVSLILENDPAWQGVFWFDVVRRRPMVDETPLTDTTITKIARWLGQTRQMSVTNLNLIERCVIALCQDHPRDLIQEWLEDLPAWDHTPRLTTWLPQCAGTESGPYGAYVSAIIPVSMVARAFVPGCIYRYVVILEGPEERLKSTLVRAIGGSEWTVELSVGIDNKEAHMMLNGAWVAELPELDAMSRSEDPRLKAFFSMRKDSYIPKYSNLRVDQERRTVFIGTTNESVYLRTQTGNTRFLPIAVTKPVDVEAFLRDRDQIFAEALASYRAHPADWWQMSVAGEAEAVEHREARRVPSVYEDALRQWLDHPIDEHIPGVLPPRQEITWYEIAEQFLKIDKEKWKDPNLQRQIAIALRAIGWEQKMEGPRDNRKRVWRRTI